MVVKDSMVGAEAEVAGGYEPQEEKTLTEDNTQRARGGTEPTC